ncbi:MAG TPA: hypothetical protein VND19_15380 [Acetobacteraceae bacterium]|nr:hypothetical protein [Acetobacteraceae bacterium]
MSTSTQPPHPGPTDQLSHHAYYQLIHTLYTLLPPPLADTLESLLVRNQAAVAKIAALAPVNADEADIAAHCVCARAQAEDVMRLLRGNAGDIPLVMKLNAQYALMERTAISLRTHLLRVQAARHKRETSSTAANADEWTSYIATQRMQQALGQAAAPAMPATSQPVHPALSGASPPPPEPEPAPDAPPPPEALPAQPAPAPAVQSPSAQSPPRRHPARTATKTEEPPRDLAAEADYYARVYPYRARAIRHHGGLPPDCDFGPPDDDLVRAIVTGTSPALRALDDPAGVAAA